MEQNVDEILGLVRELTEQYTSKESTSVTYEKAQQLMGAILYCIEEREQCRSEFDVIQTQETSSVRQIYEQGYELVKKKTAAAMNQYNEQALWFRDYENLALRETFDAIPEFFIRYDVRFYPQNHILGLDYPVLLSLERFCGIDRIDAYLECLRLEQIFLQSFSEEFVIESLERYSHDYRNLFCNLCGIVLKRFLCNRLMEFSVENREWKPEHYEELKEQILGMEKEELEQTCYEQMETYAKELLTESDRLILYLNAGIADIAVELKNEAEHGVLGRHI